MVALRLPISVKCREISVGQPNKLSLFSVVALSALNYLRSLQSAGLLARVRVLLAHGIGLLQAAMEHKLGVWR